MSNLKELKALINSDPMDMLRTKRDLVVECKCETHTTPAQDSAQAEDLAAKWEAATEFSITDLKNYASHEPS